VRYRGMRRRENTQRIGGEVSGDSIHGSSARYRPNHGVQATAGSVRSCLAPTASRA